MYQVTVINERITKDFGSFDAAKRYAEQENNGAVFIIDAMARRCCASYINGRRLANIF